MQTMILLNFFSSSAFADYLLRHFFGMRQSFFLSFFHSFFLSFCLSVIIFISLSCFLMYKIGFCKSIIIFKIFRHHTVADGSWRFQQSSTCSRTSQRCRTRIYNTQQLVVTFYFA